MNQEISVIINAQMQGFARAMQSVGRDAGRAGQDATRAFNDMERDANKSSKGIGAAFKGMGSMLAGAFAGIAVGGFFKGIVEEAANLEAVEAQFEATFASAAPEARKMVNAISKEINAVPARLDPIMASTTAKFKGLGFATEEAMQIAADSTMLAADAAAYHDMTLEDANASIQSWAMGNTDAGDAVGLYASQTEIADWVLKNHKVSMDDLTEAQKQQMRLSYADHIYETSGAQGQAARESESLSNVLGNLKSSWATLMGQMGKSVLPYVTSTIQWLSDALQNLNLGSVKEKFMGFIDYVSGTFTPLVEAVKTKFDELMQIFQDTGVIDGAKTAFEGIQTGFQWFVDNLPGAVESVAAFIDSFTFGDLIKDVQDFTEKYEYLLVFVGSAAGIYLAATGAIALFHGALALGTAIASAASLAYTAVGVALLSISWPVVAVIAVIALLVTAIYALWKNWDTVSAFLKTSWVAIKAFAIVAFGAIATFLSAVWTGAKVAIMAVWNGIKAFLSASWNMIKSVAMAVFTGLIAYFSMVFNVYRTIISAVWNGIKAFLSGVWNGIKSVATGVFNAIKSVLTTAFNGMKSTATSIWNSIKAVLTGIWNTLKSVATGAFNAIKSTITNVFNAMRSTVVNIWNGIRSTLTGIWSGIRSSASTTFNAVKTAITRPIEAAKSAVGRAISAIKGFFSGLRLKFPSITPPKLPKFSISGKFSLSPPSVPKVGLSWFANGGIATGPSVVGIGEAGDEAILPLSNKSKMRPFAKAVSSMLGNGDTSTGNGGATIINNYTINATIREDADVDKLAKAIQDKQEKLDRAGGRR